jgi:LPS-assembly lipoprotein
LWSDAPSRRRALAGLGLLAALPACGFAPAYAPEGPAQTLRGEVLPDPPGNQLAFRFVAALEDRLGRAGDGAAFALGYALSVDNVVTARTGTGGALRRALQGSASYDLRRRDGGAVIASGRVSAFTAYSDTGTSVAVRSAQVDAERRLAVILADRVVTRLLLTVPDAAP